MAASLARAAALLSEVSGPRSAPDRRRFHRARLALHGRILNQRGQELDCRTMDLSPGGARLVAVQPPKPGDRVVIYLEEIGRVPGVVSRAAAEEGFGVLFEATTHKREKIAEQLTWLINKDRFNIEEERRAPRANSSSSCYVMLENGKSIPCDVMDFSMVGASLRTSQRPDIGGWVRIGQTYGRVSRYLEDGFAVDFGSLFPPRR